MSIGASLQKGEIAVFGCSLVVARREGDIIALFDRTHHETDGELAISREAFAEWAHMIVEHNRLYKGRRYGIGDAVRRAQARLVSSEAVICHYWRKDDTWCIHRNDKPSGMRYDLSSDEANLLVVFMGTRDFKEFLARS